MSICLKCGKYPFCNAIEENKKECDKFIKRRLGAKDENSNTTTMQEQKEQSTNIHKQENQ